MGIPRHSSRYLALFALVVCATAGSAGRCDEIRLKDGKKLYGVIVAYEDNMFKVKTDFGYVLVEKDKIAQIIPNSPADPNAPKTNTPPAAKPASDAQPQAAPASTNASDATPSA